MTDIKNEIGKVYRRLTVVDRHTPTKTGLARWLCRCECGKTTVATGAALRDGIRKSCGCSRRVPRKTDAEKQATLKARRLRELDRRKELKYGLTPVVRQEMLHRQGGKCLLPSCNRAADAIDHDHKTNKVRGLLCWKCNSALGFMQDNPAVLKEAARYLEIYSCPQL